MKEKIQVFVFILPIAMICIIYHSWNGERYFNSDYYIKGNESNIHFYIDKCEVSNGKISSSGWAFVGESPEDEKIIITKKSQEVDYYVPSQIINRPDVTKSFNRYSGPDHSGFSFTTRINDYNDKITINVIKDGVIFKVSYECKF